MKALLSQAMHEIVVLRRRNEILEAKVGVMDLFATVLHTTPARSNAGAAEDVAWKLAQEIAKIEKEAAATPVPTKPSTEPSELQQ